MFRYIIIIIYEVPTVLQLITAVQLLLIEPSKMFPRPTPG